MSVQLWPESERSVSPVVSVVLMVAITLILAATAGALVFDTSDEEVEEPAPSVAESTGEFVAGGDDGQQVVNITHKGGDTVDVKNIEILVRASDCQKQVRLVDLPSEPKNLGFYSDDRTLADSSIKGDDLISQGTGFDGEGPIYAYAEEHRWTAGETISFRIKKGACDFTKSENEELEVSVVHTESNTRIINKEFTAEQPGGE